MGTINFNNEQFRAAFIKTLERRAKAEREAFIDAAVEKFRHELAAHLALVMVEFGEQMDVAAHGLAHRVVVVDRNAP